MSITKVEFKYKKPQLRYDSAKKVWIGHQVDVRAGKKRYRNTFATRGEAERFVDALRANRVYERAGLKKAEINVPLVSEVFERRLERITNHAERVRAVRIFETFQSLLDYDHPVTAIRSSHYQLFINLRSEAGVKPETVNREINVLSSAFQRAAEMFPAELEDFEPARIIRPRFKQRRRERVISEAENAAILANLYRDRSDGETEKAFENRIRIGRMWHIAWLFGLRYGEVAKLLKSDFNRKANTLRVVRWKTGTVTLFEHLPEDARDLLDAAIRSSETEYIFTISGSTPKDFYKILKSTVESIGLTWGREGVDSVTFHSLRHSFITRLVQITDIATAGSFSGHSDTSDMIPLYSHASDESRKRAMAKLYGSKDKQLIEIFEMVRSGEMGLEAFLDAVK